QEFSDQVNLPLLEQNIQVMSELLTDITNHPDVVYAAIIDHQDCIIAYTNSELIIPAVKKSTEKIDQVSFYEGNFSKKKVFNFTTGVMYSETQIGEIVIAHSAAMINKVKGIFILIAVSSFSCLLIVIAVLYYNGLGYLSGLLKIHERPKESEPIALTKGAYISCPLCGVSNSLTQNIFRNANIDKGPIIRAAGRETGSSKFCKNNRNNLLEIAIKEDLGWLKRRIVHRCTDIIERLVV
ncbi:MAG: hypothetical protein KJO26_05390, partial [Deltaproteobacteria bacterium]|nr:hypothetical protein [Deltaproteobacteria bacterium]